MHNGHMPGKARNRKAVLLRLGKYFFRYKFTSAVIVLLMLASNLLALLGPMLSGAAINAIDLDTGVDFDAVLYYCVLMAVFYAASSVLSYILSVMMIRLSQKIIRRMRQDVFEKLMTLPVGYFDRLQAGDIINRISYDIDTVNASLSNDILQAATGVITVVGAFIGMLMISPILLAVFIVTVPVSVWITIKRSRSVRPLFRKRSAALAQLNGFSEEMLSGLNTIRAYGRETQIYEKFSVKNRQAVDAYYAADYHASLIGPSVNFVNNLGMVLISTVGSLLYLFGRIRIGDVSSFLLYSRRFSGPINEFANIMGEIQSALAAAERVFGVLDESPETEDIPDAAELKAVEGSVTFDHVAFGYNPEVPVIHDLSFTADSGQTVAIVGPTGAGKTTLVNLLMRFYELDGGVIEVDGRDITTLTRDSLRRSFGMVLQETWLFDGTVAENIAYGRPNATMDEITAAAKAAYAHSFIKRLPEGYQTMIEGGGANLSAGQKQLLTIARAMLADTSMLILDEATSNVDILTEIRIQKAFRSIMEGKTTFIIAHRLSTIRDADVILVMDKGDVVEAGTHEELLQKEGIYKTLVQKSMENPSEM